MNFIKMEIKFEILIIVSLIHNFQNFSLNGEI